MCNRVERRRKKIVNSSVLTMPMNNSSVEKEEKGERVDGGEGRGGTEKKIEGM
jgi:hypothetical protein